MSTPPNADAAAMQAVNARLSAAAQAHGEGRLQEALSAYTALADVLPYCASLQYNLGSLLLELGQYPRALSALMKACDLAPEDIDTWFNLALCYHHLGNKVAAIDSYARILALDPSQVDVLFNQGNCYRELGDDEHARNCYRNVLALAPNTLPALRNLAYLLNRNGETAEALVLYRRILALRPGDASVRYLQAALTQEPLSQAPDAYVYDFFNDYADHFEQSLVHDLGYDTPNQLYACFSQLARVPVRFARGLDLGCGTGLGGVAFKPRIDTFDGVDLSPEMLRHAAAKACYHRLCEDSIDHFLCTTTDRYNFFLATDVFIYVGKLRALFTRLHALARPDALFCFSTEHLAEGEDFRLLKTGRFAYAPAYIHRLAATTGWTILVEQSAQLRREREAWITGELWILQCAGQVAT